jgi:hypothetical protein
MEDGGAGAREDLCQQYTAASYLLEILGRVGGGGWAALGQWEVKNLTMAMLVLFYGEPYGQISNIGLELACNEALDQLGPNIPYFETYQELRQYLEDTGSDFSLPDACAGFEDDSTICGG